VAVCTDRMSKSRYTFHIRLVNRKPGLRLPHRGKAESSTEASSVTGHFYVHSTALLLEATLPPGTCPAELYEHTTYEHTSLRIATETRPIHTLHGRASHGSWACASRACTSRACISWACITGFSRFYLVVRTYLLLLVVLA
jgi:hypothetical protein